MRGHCSTPLEVRPSSKPVVAKTRRTTLRRRVRCGTGPFVQASVWFFCGLLLEPSTPSICKRVPDLPCSYWK